LAAKVRRFGGAPPLNSSAGYGDGEEDSFVVAPVDPVRSGQFHGAQMCEFLPETTVGWAFFLDIDGTLIDIAPTPDAVVVPPTLPIMLKRLSARAGGAVALVSGRSIETIDRLLAPARLPLGALHGAEMRFPDGRIVLAPESQALDNARRRLAAFVAAHPGVLLEDKGPALAIHYRTAPRLRDAVEAEVRAAAAAAGDAFIVQPGKMVLELRPAGFSKGSALSTLMSQPAFAGRRPLAVGDDVTDEAMFEAALQAGGSALRVGTAEGDSLARVAFDRPAAVRDWISRLISTPDQ
jgi:trehalose 6-phosphate phosphatase